MDAADAQRSRDALAGIAGAAGRAVMKEYEAYGRLVDAGEATRYAAKKEDDSPLTRADLAADGVIKRLLPDVWPGVPVVSEEDDPSAKDVAETGRVWLVDPMDGTKEFLSQNGEFTVNIALVEAGAPVLGIVFAPVLGRIWFGAVGVGAWRGETHEEDAKIVWEDISVAGWRRGEPLKVVASRSHPDPLLGRFLEEIEATGTVVESIAMGSSLKFCLVADGTAHLYPRFGPTMWWDTAAAHAVVGAAGGTVTDLNGETLRYAGKTLRNPSFVAGGFPSYPWRRHLADRNRATGTRQKTA
ncbi:MAG: 3'(2'),5'-bisphosphate nucleotidase CysQ [Euryarchaeota archaeon]|nr:3'(2'),5'-bisphosphate nucleotidase CysQ [Euryarchaeota archaeon]